MKLLVHESVADDKGRREQPAKSRAERAAEQGLGQRVFNRAARGEASNAGRNDANRRRGARQATTDGALFGTARDEDRLDQLRPSTVVIERQMLPMRIESSAAVGSKPQWTMQSVHFGLPLLWPYFDQSVVSNNSWYDFA